MKRTLPVSVDHRSLRWIRQSAADPLVLAIQREQIAIYCVWLILLLLLMLAGLQPVFAQDPTPTPSAIPVATSQMLWRGRIVSQTEGGGFMGRLIVRVADRTGVPVEISTEGGWSATAATGSKPEYGPFACEFAGLSPDSYYINPQGLGVSLWITLKEGETVTVEFAPSTAPVSPTGACMVRVLNRGYQTVYLTIAQKEYELGPTIPNIIRLSPGTHTYTLFSPGYEPINSEVACGAGYWTWNIDMEGGLVEPVAGPMATPGTERTPVAPPMFLPITGADKEAPSGSNCSFLAKFYIFLKEVLR